jgi:hypothetical protein
MTDEERVQWRRYAAAMLRHLAETGDDGGDRQELKACADQIEAAASELEKAIGATTASAYKAATTKEA